MTPEQLPIESYEQQFAEKISRLNMMMIPFNAPMPKTYRSPVRHYRMRAEFRIWHEGDELYHIIFDKENRQRIRVDLFPAACKLINQMMSIMMRAMRDNPLLRHKLFQIDYLATTSNQIVISLLYHRRIDNAWQEAVQALQQQLVAQGQDVHFIGRAAKTKIVINQDYVDETLTINGQRLFYRQVENSFTQPNATINVHMIEWALAVTQHLGGDLLELYCGNGNFTLALARNFKRVLATEIAKRSVESAQYNIDQNQIDNVQIIRMSAEELTQALRGVRTFNRLQNIFLNSYQCSTIFVDPPRCGLDLETLHLAQEYQYILYISCNPLSLCENLVILSQSHQVTQVAMFDQFPYTEHMECGVLLTRKV